MAGSESGGEALNATVNTTGGDADADRRATSEENAEADDAAFRKHQQKAATDAVKRAKEHLKAAEKVLATVKKDN